MSSLSKWEGGLEALQARLEEAAEVKATTTATWNKNKIQDSERDQEDGDRGGEMQESCPQERAQEKVTASPKGI